MILSSMNLNFHITQTPHLLSPFLQFLDSHSPYLLFLIEPHLQPSSPAASSPASSSPSTEISAAPSPPSVPFTSIHPMVTRAQNNISKPREFSDGKIRYPLLRALFVESSPIDIDPTCHSSIVKDKHWKQL
jgi:hypothetical protein